MAHALRYFGMDCPLSVLVSFDESGAVGAFQCDAALPATIEGRTIGFVDLDLDVMAGPNLSHRTRDQATFERNRRAMRYPPRVVKSARAGIKLAERLIGARKCPFDGSPEQLLGADPRRARAALAAQRVAARRFRALLGRVAPAVAAILRL